jgi:hypothetical protein
VLRTGNNQLESGNIQGTFTEHLTTSTLSQVSPEDNSASVTLVVLWGQLPTLRSFDVLGSATPSGVSIFAKRSLNFTEMFTEMFTGLTGKQQRLRHLGGAMGAASHPPIL